MLDKYFALQMIELMLDAHRQQALRLEGERGSILVVSAHLDALRAFHHAVAIEERHSSIDFTIVHPTSTETPMLEQEARDESSAFAFVTTSVSAAFVAETIVTAIDDKSGEVFMPPEAADDIISLGVHPDKLLAIFDRAEQHGRDVQRRRHEP